MISVVVPNLNEERYLPYFLDSLKRQTYRDFELVVVDGYSMDKSIEIIERYEQFFDITIIFTGVRNFGHIRNLGHLRSRGNIVLQANSDNYFPPNFLKRLRWVYLNNGDVVSVTGRVYPNGTSWVAMFAYPAFDLLRWLSVKFGKYRPSGSFLSYRRGVFAATGGFPPVTVNEDGLFGQEIDKLKCQVKFCLGLYVGHWVKKFEDMGGLKALMFYMYVLGNHFPLLKPLLKPIERKAGDVFSGRCG